MLVEGAMHLDLILKRLIVALCVWSDDALCEECESIWGQDDPL